MLEQRVVITWLLGAILCFLTPSTVQAGLLDTLGGVMKKAASPESTTSTLSSEEIASGLKQALSQGVAKAIAGLGVEDGFLGNAEVRIPLPESLGTVEKGLRLVGKGEMADAFVQSMNRAAEQAVPEAREVFMTTLEKMTLEDARKILSGPDDAATQYFERTTRSSLKERFLPLVATATDAVGVTRRYKSMMRQAGPVARMAGFAEADLDAYVTDKGLDGLFLMIAREEKQIRENPVARTTDLLRKVFGH